MANITTTEANSFIPEIWLSMALGRLPKYLLLANTCTKDYELGGGTFNVGSKLHIPVRGSITVNQKTESGNFTVQNPTATTVDVTLNHHPEVTIAGSDVALAVANQNFMAGYIEDGVKAIAEDIESNLQGLYSSIAGGNTITASTTIAEADVLSARKLLIDNGVNALENMYAIVSTKQANALRVSTNTARFDATGEQALIANALIGDGSMPFPGSFGKLFNFNMVESQLVPYPSSVSKNLFYTKDAVVLATRALQEPPVGSGAIGTTMTDPQTGVTMRLFLSFNPNTGAQQMTLDCLYGYNLLRANHAVLVNAN